MVKTNKQKDRTMIRIIEVKQKDGIGYRVTYRDTDGARVNQIIQPGRDAFKQAQALKQKIETYMRKQSKLKSKVAEFREIIEKNDGCFK